MYGVTTEWMRSLLMKLTVSYYIIKHMENLCDIGNFILVEMWPPFFVWITARSCLHRAVRTKIDGQVYSAS